MKNLNYIIVGLIFAVTFTNSANAQEFHLSQYDAFQLYYNPALTGNYLGEEADYKVNLVSRSQWRPLQGKPFSTNGVSYDMPYKKFGLGGYILNNKSGAANFNTTNVQASGSYFITDPKSSPHLINVGLQMGLFYKTFNPTNLLFESQYDNSTGTLNSGIESGENFQRTKVLKFDASIGVFYKYKDKKNKYAPFIGFSINHLPMASEAFSTSKFHLPMKFNLQLGCDYVINEKIKVIPMLMYMNQAKAYDFNIGCLGYYTIKNTSETKYDVIFGLNYRVKDAILLQCGFKKDNAVIRMSYDITTSYLNSYNKGRGGFELTLQLSGKKGQSPFKSLSKF